MSSNYNYIEEYTKTYTSFSGCDIVASFNGVIIGELQGITYSVSREKAPVYTLGSPEPRSFARGKRGIAGTLVFTVFDRDALIEEFKSYKISDTITKFRANAEQSKHNNYMSIDTWDQLMTTGSDADDAPAKYDLTKTQMGDLAQEVAPTYADELLPFDITITFANEYGQKAFLTIYGVELLNEGSGYSIDTVTTEKAYTFIARSLSPIQKADAADLNGKLPSASNLKHI